MSEPKVCRVCEHSIPQARVEWLPNCERCAACQKSFDSICQKYGPDIAENVEEYGKKLLILDPSLNKFLAGLVGEGEERATYAPWWSQMESALDLLNRSHEDFNELIDAVVAVSRRWRPAKIDRGEEHQAEQDTPG